MEGSYTRIQGGVCRGRGQEARPVQNRHCGLAKEEVGRDEADDGKQRSAASQRGKGAHAAATTAAAASRCVVVGFLAAEHAPQWNLRHLAQQWSQFAGILASAAATTLSTTATTDACWSRAAATDADAATAE